MTSEGLRWARLAALALAFAAVVATSGCWPPVLVGRLCGLNPFCPTPTEREIVASWLECIDCPEQYLDSVVSRARTTSWGVVLLLGWTLTRGPDSASVRTLDADVRHAYQEVLAYVQNRPTRSYFSTNVDSVVAREVQRLAQSWQMRAAIALGRIGNKEALGWLDSACSLPTHSTPTAPAAASSGGVSPLSISVARVAVAERFRTDTLSASCSLRARILGVALRVTR